MVRGLSRGHGSLRFAGVGALVAACSVSPGGDGTAVSVTADAGGDLDGDAFQKYNLELINQYRTAQGIAPLALDTSLNAFAVEATTQLSRDHTPHQHFADAIAAGAIFNLGFKSSAGENQGDPNGWRVMSEDPTVNERMQIEDIEKTMFAEGPGTDAAHGHYESMMNVKYRRLGVGLLMVDGKLYLTNDFSD